MVAAPVRVVLRRATFPGLIDLQGGEPSRQWEMQALAGNDGIQIGMLAEGAPVVRAQGRAAPATTAASGAALPLGPTEAPGRAGTIACWRVLAATSKGWGQATDRSLRRDGRHGRSRVSPACCTARG